MLDYILIYLAIGLVAVLSFPKPIKEAVSNVQLVASLTEDNFEKWRITAFGLLLAASMVLLWPYYLLVAYQKWKASRPMTMKEIERWLEWEEKHYPGRRTEKNKNRKPVSFVTPLHESDASEHEQGQS